MAALVFANQESGTLSRYEVGGEEVRKTHFYAHGAPAVFEWPVLQEFRLSPPDKWKLDPDPSPTNPSADAGQLPCDVEMAA